VFELSEFFSGQKFKFAPAPAPDPANYTQTKSHASNILASVKAD
jgi:hypothetical protein